MQETKPTALISLARGQSYRKQHQRKEVSMETPEFGDFCGHYRLD